MSALFDLHKAAHQCAMEQASAFFYATLFFAIGAALLLIYMVAVRVMDRMRAQAFFRDLRGIVNDAQNADGSYAAGRAYTAEDLVRLAQS